MERSDPTAGAGIDPTAGAGIRDDERDHDERELEALAAFLAASPSPYHAVEQVASRLGAAGWSRLDERDAWSAQPGRFLVVRGGTLVAWSTERVSLSHGFRVVGAHTDSPNLRVKPNPDTGAAGFRQIGVEVYGGALLNSWLDRDLGLSGRVTVRSPAGPEVRLLKVDEALARIPQLAIHLDRGVNEHGLVLNPQAHLVPVWGLGAVEEGRFAGFVADRVGSDPHDLLAWDLMLHDLAPPARLGADHSMLSAPRIDNLLSCHAATSALIERERTDRRTDHSNEGPVPVVCLFDHEEVGSQTAGGAAGSVLPTVLERVAATLGADREGFHRALAASVCASADGAHATHPNYLDRHEPAHRVLLDGGPVLKSNSNARYATDALAAAHLVEACEQAGVSMQRFVVRSDLPCGSTIGPVTAAKLGIPTADIGVAQLSMHSARELCGTRDPGRFARMLAAFLDPR